jgi:hypothetical protein
MTGHFAKLMLPPMSRTLQSVFTPGSEVISAGAWHAAQRIALVSCFTRRAATAVDNIGIPARLQPSRRHVRALRVPADSYFASSGDL